MTFWAEAKKSVLHSEICHLTSQADTPRVANVFFLSEPLLETTNGPRFCNGSKLQHENVVYCWGIEVKAFSRFFHSKRNTLWHLTSPPNTHSPLSLSVVSNGCLQEGRNSLLRSVLLSAELIWWRGNKCLL